MSKKIKVIIFAIILSVMFVPMTSVHTYAQEENLEADGGLDDSLNNPGDGDNDDENDQDIYSGWDESHTYYFDEDGQRVTDNFVTIEEKIYYFDETGAVVTGWQTIEEKIYYFDETGAAVTGWQTIEEKIYYFDENGAAVTSVKKSIDGNIYYFDENGAAVTSVKKSIDGKIYYFGSNGVAVTSVKKSIDGNIYYFGSSGYALTGKRSISGKIYYFGSNGVAVTSVKKSIDGNIYYFGSSGYALTGKRSIGGKIYYFDSKCVAVTGWKTIDGKKWYFKTSGTDKGVRLSGWQTISSKKYYLYSSGNYATGWTLISNKTYYFSKSGVLKVGKSDKSVKLNGLIINKSGVCTTDGKTSTNIMNTLNKQIKKDLKAAGGTSLSDRKKVDKLFKYLCRKCSYKHMMVNPYVTTFSSSTAYKMLNSGRGNCYCYASAFAYLVKAATGYQTRVSYGVCTIRKGWGRGTYSHGWTEIKIGGVWKIFDVELYDRGSFSSRYSTGKTYSAMKSAGTTYKRYGYVNITL